MKAEGLKAGVPDICLPVARGGWHALYIELKRQDGGRVSDAQRAWLHALQDEGNRAMVCHGWAEAAEAIKEYMEGGPKARLSLSEPEVRQAVPSRRQTCRGPEAAAPSGRKRQPEGQ